MEQTQTLNLYELVALFLAEAVRSRRTSLARAAEISKRVISFLPKLKTENETLAALTEIEKDFEEITALKQALHFGYNPSDTKIFEAEIKEYASKFFLQDLTLSSDFLEDASKPGMTIQRLCLKYPDFCNYLLANSEKAKAVPGLKDYSNQPG